MSHLKLSKQTVETLIGILAMVLLFAGLAFIAAGLAGAQPTETTPSPTPTPAPNETGERIQKGLTLVSAEYDGDGTATLVFRSDDTVAVTLTDAGAFFKGGEMRRRTEILQEGTHKITFPVTETPRGAVGVTVATSETLYAVPIEKSEEWFDGDATWGYVQIAGVGSGVGILLAAGLLAYYRKFGGRQESDRIT